MGRNVLPKAGAKYRSDQARAPRGDPDGGQWVDEGGGSGGGGSGSSDNRTISDANDDDADFWKPGAQVAQNDHGPPKIPKNRPNSGRERNRIIKEVAKWAGRYGGVVGKLVEGVVWAYELEPYVSAYLDEPQTLEELPKRVAAPARGYDIHHIVEQTPAEREGFGRDIIDGPDNLVRIPTLKHWQINGWFGTKQRVLGGLSPREYLRGKNWAERTRIGHQALIEHGVLKP